MPAAVQIEFPFGSLDFPGRTVITVDEIAERLGITARHVIDLHEEGALCPALDLGGKDASRRTLRFPIETYRDFVLKRATGSTRREFLRTLPRPALVHMRAEINELLGD